MLAEGLEKKMLPFFARHTFWAFVREVLLDLLFWIVVFISLRGNKTDGTPLERSA
jgi:hypothetical protein